MTASPATVLVVGAGPTGLAAAITLARAGASVRIVDLADAATTLSKALVLWRRSLLTLDPAVPFERFLEHGSAVRGARFYEDGKLGPVLDMPRGDHELPPGVLVPQSDTEQILGETLESLGVRVERSTRLVQFTSHADGVRCELEGPHGRETLEVGWLLGCDGAHSTVRHGLGVAFPGETVSRRWILGDIEIAVEDGINPHRPECEEERTLEPGWMHLDGGRAGAAAIFPMNRGRFRVIFDGGPASDDAAPRDVTETEIAGLLHARTRLQWRIVRSHWLAEFRINERQVERYVHGRVLLCGDAAHVHSPAGGQGMNTGLQDAVNAAWKVALAARGEADPALVESYHAERHPVGAKVLAMSGRMLRASMISNPLLARLRGFGMLMAFGIPAVRRRLAASLTEDDIDYADGPLAEGGHGAGHVLPDVAIDRDGARRPATDLLRGASGVLLLGQEADAANFRSTTWLASRTTHRLGEAESSLAAAIGLEPKEAALVRPDGVIAAIGGPDALGQWCAAAGIR